MMKIQLEILTPLKNNITVEMQTSDINLSKTKEEHKSWESAIISLKQHTLIDQACVLVKISAKGGNDG